jgi:SAM-dependent methyltransferase
MKKKAIEILTPGSLAPQDDYPEAFRKHMYEIEEQHFWHKGRNSIIESVVKRHLQFKKKLSYLEIGCGNGIVLKHLESKFNWHLEGIDLSLFALNLARKRTKARLMRADIFKVSMSRKYDVIGLFDVIEHVDDDSLFLKQCSKLLDNNGKIIITVPACPSLWSVVDKASGHKRRYTLKSLEKIISGTGLKVNYITHYGITILPFFWMSRFLSVSNYKKNDIEILTYSLKVPSFVTNFVLGSAFQIEANVIKRRSIPIGTSLVAIVS